MAFRLHHGAHPSRPHNGHAPAGYVKDLAGFKVYVKSYNGYGIMAARAKILWAGADPVDGTHPCIPRDFEGGCTER